MLSALLMVVFGLLASPALAVTNPLIPDDTTVSTTILGFPSPPAPSSPYPTATAMPGEFPGSIHWPQSIPATPVSPQPPISPKIPEIEGYGPADSLITLTGIGISESTTTDQNGHFVFNSLTLPTLISGQAGYFFPEICFYAKDDVGRMSATTCLPPLSLEVKTSRVGPVILSPTLSLSDKTVSGRTFPNSPVTLYITRKFFPYPLIKDQTRSKSSGEFSFALAQGSGIWKVYAVSDYEGISTPPTNPLTFVALPPLTKLITIYEEIVRLIQNDFYLAFVFLELLILIPLVIVVLKKPKRV